MRVGLVCPYSLDVPGGVQNHVRDLAVALLERGHEVGVLAPGDPANDFPDYVEVLGKAVAVPYNGSVARLAFGPRVAARTSRWLREGGFDVIHVHEPVTPSVSLLALWACEQPVVATFHTAHLRSRTMSSVATLLRPSLEKITARIAVSEAARSTLVHHLGGEPVVIPNGLFCATFHDAEVRPEWSHPGPVLAFLGRIDEPRKGLVVLLAAMPAVLEQFPDVRLLVAGPGDVPPSVLNALPPATRDRVNFLGQLSDLDRAQLLRSATVYVAPQTGGESFGIVLAEAMAAATPVVASDLPAFRAVLGDGRLGRLFATGDADGLGRAICQVLDDPGGSAEVSLRAADVVRRYDWSVVADDVLAVYETIVDRRSEPG